MVGLPGRKWCQVQTLLCVRLRGESLGRSILGCGRPAHGGIYVHTQLPPVVAGMVVASWGPDFLMLEATGCMPEATSCTVTYSLRPARM